VEQGCCVIKFCNVIGYTIQYIHFRKGWGVGCGWLVSKIFWSFLYMLFPSFLSLFPSQTVCSSFLLDQLMRYEAVVISDDELTDYSASEEESLPQIEPTPTVTQVTYLHYIQKRLISKSSLVRLTQPAPAQIAYTLYCKQSGISIPLFLSLSVSCFFYPATTS